MNEILKLLNSLTADELEGVIVRANIMLEKKRRDEAEQALLEKERLRQEKIAQEMRRQQEIAELQRKLNELQRQEAYTATEPVEGYNFVMHDKPVERPVETPKTVACPRCGQANPVGSAFCANCGQNMKAASRPHSSRTIACPHCGQANPEESVFCSNCGQNMKAKTAPKPQEPSGVSCPHCGQINPVGSVFCVKCGQNMSVKPAPQAANAAAPASGVPGVQHADENMKKWEMLPGEEMLWNAHEVRFVSPDGGKKFNYFMAITNKRILFTREGSVAHGATTLARMSGGLVGQLVASGIKSAANAGPRPYMAVRLSAITNYGVEGKNYFFMEAGERILLHNHRYEKLLPTFIENAKKNRF